MDEKEKDLELENVSETEDNTASVQDGAGIRYEENDNWQFDASAPTLDGSLDIGNDYEIEVAEESKTNANEYKEVSHESEAETGEYKQEPQDDEDEEDEKVKRNFIVNRKALKITLIAAACAVVVAIIAFCCVRFFLYPNSSEIMTPGNIAFTVGETPVSVGYYNYYYNATVEAYLEEAEAGYLDLKVYEDFSTQYTTDDDGNQITWEQKFKDDTIWQIQYLTAYYEAAVKAGVELTDEQKESIDSNISSLRLSASDENKSIGAFLKENGGEYCGEKTMRTIFERYYIAVSYVYQKQVELAASKEEIQKYFDDNQENYKSASFALIEMSYSEEDDMDEVKAKAQAYCDRVDSYDDFKALIPEASKDLIEQYIAYGYASDENGAIEAITNTMQYTKTKDEVVSFFASEEIADWLYSEDTAVGSVAYFVDPQYSCIDILFKDSEPDFDNTELYSVRHILIMPESDEEAQWAAAEEEADRILEEYNASDKTELAFALLAEQYSADTYSTSAAGYGYYGGELFGTALGAMVPEFESWSVDASRKYGDVDIVKSQYGYHIMFFVMDGPSYLFSAQGDADNMKEDEFVASYEVKEQSGMSKTTVAQPIVSEN